MIGIHSQIENIFFFRRQFLFLSRLLLFSVSLVFNSDVLSHFSVSTHTNVNRLLLLLLSSSSFFKLTSNQNLPNNRSTHSKCVPYSLDLLFTSRDICILNMSMRLAAFFHNICSFFSSTLTLFFHSLLLCVYVYVYVFMMSD